MRFWENLSRRPIMRPGHTCFVVCSPRNRGGTNSLKYIRHCFSNSFWWLYCDDTCNSWGPCSWAWSPARASCWPGCAAPPGRAPDCTAPAPASLAQSPRPPWPFCRTCQVFTNFRLTRNMKSGGNVGGNSSLEYSSSVNIGGNVAKKGFILHICNLTICRLLHNMSSKGRLLGGI